MIPAIRSALNRNIIAPAAASNMMKRHGAMRGPFSGFGGRAPRQPAKSPMRARANPKLTVVEIVIVPV